MTAPTDLFRNAEAFFDSSSTSLANPARSDTWQHSFDGMLILLVKGPEAPIKCHPCLRTTVAHFSGLNTPLGREEEMRHCGSYATSTPSDSVSLRYAALRRCVIGPISPVPIVRPSTLVTAASSPIVPVQKTSSAR